MSNCVIEVRHRFIIHNTICKMECKNTTTTATKEYYSAACSWLQYARRLSFCDIVCFILAEDRGNFYCESIDFHERYGNPLTIETQYDCTHITPKVEYYKAAIDEYCQAILPASMRQKRQNWLTRTHNKLKSRINIQYMKRKFLGIY